MIRWRLRVIMAEKNINNKTLAEMTGLNPVTISRLKNTDELKQISGHVLNQLCSVLECTPNDLIQFTPDFEEPDAQNFSTKTKPSHLQQIEKRTDRDNDDIYRGLSGLCSASIIEILESA